MSISLRHVCIAALLLLAPLPASAGAVFRALDKAAGRAQDLTAPLNAQVHFGTLELTVRACVQRPPEEEPETSVFLEVTDLRPGGRKVLIFSGWMYASSPAVNALEHRFYDVWPVRCTTSLGEEGASGGLN